VPRPYIPRFVVAGHTSGLPLRNDWDGPLAWRPPRCAAAVCSPWRDRQGWPTGNAWRLPSPARIRVVRGGESTHIASNYDQFTYDATLGFRQIIEVQRFQHQRDRIPQIRPCFLKGPALRQCSWNFLTPGDPPFATVQKCGLVSLIRFSFRFRHACVFFSIYSGTISRGRAITSVSFRPRPRVQKILA
jgi:hypothetical protein